MPHPEDIGSPSPATPYTAAHATISQRGAQRWQHGHPWIYRSDVIQRPAVGPGAVPVRDKRGRPLGWALWSPRSEISFRLLDSDPSANLDQDWWRHRLARSIARRRSLDSTTSAMRLVHAEADGLPSLICDRYDRWLVVQLLSAGLEAFRTVIVATLLDLTGADGILARNDAAVREREGLPREVTILSGDVPHLVEVREEDIRYLAAPYDGQKTGAFLDQRENRLLAGAVARGHALDCFSYHGSFAIHLAQRATRVTALDSSEPALARARENARLNGLENIEFMAGNAFDVLRAEESAGARYETIVLDPPAFAKSRNSLPAALRGYKEINLRAMRLLTPGGLLLTASCSHHLSKALFMDMLAAAAADSGRRIALRELRGQPLDHPEILTIPETGYLKGALLEALD